VPLGIDGADYYANETEYYRLDIEGNSGILVSSSVPTPMLVANSRFRTTGPAISMRTLWTSASRADWIGPRQVALQNVSFVPPPSGLHRAISMQFRAEPTRNLIARDEIRVQASNMGSFRVYYAEQRPSFVIPQTVANSDGTPSLLGVSSAGLTNQQAFSQFKVAIAGSVAPCATTVPQIEGLVCDGVATTPAPGDPPVTEPPGSDPPPPGADPPPPPSDGAGPCTVSEWGAWGPWSEWKVVRHLMMRIRVRTRTIINPGSAVPRLCPSLTDTETEVMPFERTEAAASGGHH
jgi:hypothetical protein